ncbi:hypothetical protein N431DRAFT_454124 [Stipitochalara longipes BDJ]|nr:hypothetical protein N431DRAFT_454124 [Stipitochalara longipes BDJ]
MMKARPIGQTVNHFSRPAQHQQPPTAGPYIVQAAPKLTVAASANSVCCPGVSQSGNMGGPWSPWSTTGSACHPASGGRLETPQLAVAPAEEQIMLPFIKITNARSVAMIGASTMALTTALAMALETALPQEEENEENEGTRLRAKDWPCFGSGLHRLHRLHSPSPRSRWSPPSRTPVVLATGDPLRPLRPLGPLVPLRSAITPSYSTCWTRLDTTGHDWALAPLRAPLWLHSGSTLAPLLPFGCCQSPRAGDTPNAAETGEPVLARPCSPLLAQPSAAESGKSAAPMSSAGRSPATARSLRVPWF